MNNKKTILILILVLTIGLIGLGIAYFSNSTSFDNLFSTNPYGSTVTEQFISPDNWLPGDVTEKTIVATNSGNVDQAVRIKITEKWLDSNNNELNGWIHEDGTKSNHTTEEELSTDERVAIINFDNNSDWTKVGDYYYYNYKLSPNESTSSLIKSVTFNPNTKLDDTCTSSVSNGKKTVTCNSSGSDYDNAKYTLTFKIETVQFNKYMNAWNTDVAIASEKSQGENFAQHIIRKANDVTVNNYTDGVTTEAYTFNHEQTEQTSDLTDYRYIGENPNNYVYFNCDDNGSNCEVWRIIGVFDIDDGSGNYEPRVKLVRGSAFTEEMKWDYDREIEPRYPGDIKGINKWNEAKLNVFLNSEYLSNNGDENTYGLKQLAQLQIADAKYYLGAGPDDSTTHYGSADDIYIWERGTNVYNKNGAERSTFWIGKVGLMYLSDYAYVFSNGVDSNCFNDPSECSPTYEDYVPNQGLVTRDREKPGYPQTNWIYNSNNLENQPGNNINLLLTYSYNGNTGVHVINRTGPITFGDPNNNAGVRPVVYLKSDVKKYSGDGSPNSPYCLLENCNSNSANKAFKIGDSIKYRNSNYCVIQNSGDIDYVTVIKQEPLTFDELAEYNNGYEIGIDGVDNDTGVISYYKSDTCYYNSESDHNTVGCSIDYNDSFIKNVVNNWSNVFNNDLMEIDGYKVRLITGGELRDMGHIVTGTTEDFNAIKSSYDCLYSDADYWTISTNTDGYEISVVSKIDNNNRAQFVDKKYAVRPVINLKKCAIDNTCE